jgi:hypothetical protein
MALDLRGYGSGSGGSGMFAPTQLHGVLVTDLDTLVGRFPDAVIECYGHHADADGGGGPFAWRQGSSAAADGGIIVGSTVYGRWERIFSGPVSVAWYGPEGDGITDDTATLAACIAYCENTGSQIIGYPGTYLITSTLTINCSGELSAMTINAAGASFSPAVRVGLTTGSGSAAQLLLDLVLPKITNTSKVSTGWAGFSSAIGLEVANLYESRLTIPRVAGFGIGVQIAGYSAGNVYNEYRLGMLWQNKIQLKVGPAQAAGWSNENTSYGGRFGYDSAEGANIAGAYSILLAGTAGTGNVNNNLFIRPCVEGDEPQYHVNFEDASFNTLLNPRFEVPSDPVRIRFYSSISGETNSNLIIGGYELAAHDVTFSGVCPYNKRVGGRQGDALDYTGCGLNIANQSGNSESSPQLQGFNAGINAYGKTDAAVDWSWRLYGWGLSGKAQADAAAKLILDYENGRLYLGAGAAAPTRYLSSISSGLLCVGGYYPGADNTYDLGSGGLRWGTVYAATGAINTSDRRQKTDESQIDNAERMVAKKLTRLIRKYRFVGGKRSHVGVVAQDVAQAFLSEGLDPHHYAMFCHDEWNEERSPDGTVIRPSGDAYGIRYAELICFILAANE